MATQKMIQTAIDHNITTLAANMGNVAHQNTSEPPSGAINILLVISSLATQIFRLRSLYHYLRL
jgi:hypothetical protein